MTAAHAAAPSRSARPPRARPRVGARPPRRSRRCPFAGECSPAIPRAWGSISRMPAASMRRRPGDAVGAAAALELLQAPELLALGRHDHLAARSCGDLVLRAVLVQLARTLHAQARLQRPRLVVDPRVDHPRVVAGLVCAQLGLALEHAHRQPRVAAGQLAGQRQARRSRRRRSPDRTGRALPRQPDRPAAARAITPATARHHCRRCASSSPAPAASSARCSLPHCWPKDTSCVPWRAIPHVCTTYQPTWSRRERARCTTRNARGILHARGTPDA